MSVSRFLCSIVLIYCLFFNLLSATAQEEKKSDDQKEETTKVTLGEGIITMHATKKWEVIKPKVRFIEAEFAIKASEGDDNNGRLTMMGAGGSIEQNIDRWKQQFSPEDGKTIDESTKVEKKEIGGQEVHVVDIVGTYADSRGPRTPATKREGYRMLAAIIVTDKGKYFVKFYGPATTVGDNEKHFASLLKSMKVGDKN